MKILRKSVQYIMRYSTKYASFCRIMAEVHKWAPSTQPITKVLPDYFLDFFCLDTCELVNGDAAVSLRHSCLIRNHSLGGSCARIASLLECESQHSSFWRKNGWTERCRLRSSLSWVHCKQWVRWGCIGATTWQIRLNDPCSLGWRYRSNYTDIIGYSI